MILAGQLAKEHLAATKAREKARKERNKAPNKVVQNKEKYTVIRRVGRSQRTKKMKEGLSIYRKSVLQTLGGRNTRR
jgi:hypothetical protein